MLLLHGLHTVAVIVNDFKLGNILIGNDGMLKLTDLSLACARPKGQLKEFLDEEVVGPMSDAEDEIQCIKA